MTKELSIPQQIAIMALLSETMDSWLNKIRNMRIPSREWTTFKKNALGFIQYPTIFPLTLSDGKSFNLGMVNYTDGMSFVCGSRIDSFYTAYSFSVTVDHSIDIKQYIENNHKLGYLVQARLLEESEKNLLKAIQNVYPEADQSWKWKNGLPKAMNKEEWMTRLYHDSWKAVFNLPFATEVEKCTKIFNSAKGDNPKIPCLYGAEKFQIYESNLRFGSFISFSGNTSIRVGEEMKTEMKKFAEEFKKKYEFYIANVAKKQLIGLLPKIEEPVSV
ncbi:MAG: hypothetical protein NTX91_02430 [candidate division SR1 bacterium]|nr:hypothetical protein [candidate division SR1 bacterium]